MIVFLLDTLSITTLWELIAWQAFAALVIATILVIKGV